MKALLIAFLLAISAHYISAKAIIQKTPFDDDEIIGCEYIFDSRENEYICLLTLRNPNGVEFDEVVGDHLDGFSNDDVGAVSGFFQNTPIIPSVICRQFPNLWSLVIDNSFIVDITPAAFAECTNLRQLILQGNQITTIPANIFANSASLETIDVGFNRINEIDVNAFTGTAIQNLELAFNQLGSINNNWFSPISSTLLLLDLMGNGINEIASGSFVNLASLQDLYLDFNTLTSIANNAFNGLTSLERFFISSTTITELIPEWFSTLSSLSTFAATTNEIRELPEGVFATLGNLQFLHLYNNRIREISSAAFGELGVRNLRTLYITNNLVNNIDPFWLNDAENLQYLLLSGNLCTNEDFFNVQDIRWRIFEQLMRCTDNFAMEPYLGCNYNAAADGGYGCSFYSHNPNGFNGFDAIDGEHLEGRTNEDVTTVTALWQNSRIIPSILCSTFPNLQVIFFMQSNVEDLSEESFAECRNLEILYLHDNWINGVPDFTFRNNQNLRQLELGLNWIEILSENSFTGSAIENLDLDNNRLYYFDQSWFAPINETLVTLDVVGNNIRAVEEDAFSNLRNLNMLVFGNNPLVYIPSDAFQSLTNLQLLTLDRTGIYDIDPQWFIGLTNLQRLYLQNNQIREFPDNIFNSLTSLTQLTFSDNQLREVTASAFGASLSGITHLTAQNNRIRAFDPEILDGATNLEWLLLGGNICTQEDYSNVQNNLDNVRNRLSTCFGNFGTEEIRCNYAEYDGMYTCSLTINNPLGRNNFDSIDGDHLPGFTDADVQGIYVFGGNTINIPSILCTQFPNLVEMDFMDDRIEYLEIDSFRGCQNLRNLLIYDNLIREIPNGIFNSNPNLEFVSFGRNRLTSLTVPSNTFVNTNINFLDLSNNPLGFFNDNWVRPISATLRTLDIVNIGVNSLFSTSLDSLVNLEILVLANNPLSELPDSIFANLRNLNYLAMGDCQFRNINPVWFENLSNLQTLQIYNNRILDLPTNAFNSLTNLTTLYVYSNNLRELRVDTFGASISSVRAIYASFNEIIAIDPAFIDSLTSIEYIYLSSNLCTQENFYEINENRERVNELLNVCFSYFAGEAITCSYILNADNNYACMMEIFNPVGRDGFSGIPGNHMAGFNDDSVWQVNLIFQNSRIVPAIICEQFRNIREIIIYGSQLDVLTERSFAGCTELTDLIMFDNTLFEIPDFVFINNENLRYLEIGMNRLERLSDNSLTGTAIDSLDISSNYLVEFNPRWFAPINATLRSLDLLFNNIQSLPQDAFRQLRDLRLLALNGNPLGMLPPNVFEASDNLESLFLSNCSLSFLNNQWFRNLRNVVRLEINQNSLTQLPNGIFNQMTSLQHFSFESNFIWEINSQIFGNSITSLTNINARDNIVNIIDASFITSATSLNIFSLTNNVCTNQDFADVANYTWVTLEQLAQCTYNFILDEELICDYNHVTADQYTCILNAHNPRGFDGFSEVQGNHLDGQNNDNVVMVYVNNQEIRNFPTIICEQFGNLEDIVIFNSNLLEVSSRAFENCVNLVLVIIDGNLLRTLPDNLFNRSPSLAYISFAANRITEISSTAFAGTSIQTVDLAFNQLTNFNSAAFAAINETMTMLDLNNNRLSFFSFDAFDGARNIRELYLNSNPLREIYSGTFAPLINLDVLSMVDCGLVELNPVMFYNLVNLRSLFLQNNNIEVLPDGAFHNMSSLETLYIYGNRLRELTAIQFGGALGSIRIINAPSNQINAIDPDILESAPNLNYWLLTGNLCTNDDFLGIQDDIENVRQGLSTCFDNFRLEPSIECSYQDTELNEYSCALSIHNPNGDQFEMIAGEHLDGRGNEHVQLITSTFQNTRNFPTIICSTFNDIREILVMYSNLEIVTPEAFENCVNLEILYLYANRISVVPANSFLSSPNLHTLSLGSNQIVSLNANSLAGTGIAFLDLGDNRVTNLNPVWFVTINATLTTLDLISNSITSIGTDLFRDLRNIETLALNLNGLNLVAEDAFVSLANLQLLALGNCNLREINANWFNSLGTLQRLYLFSNGIRELPENSFNSLVSLEYLELSNNGLTELRLNSFGASAASINNLQASSNLINSIDPELFDAATNLNILYLGSNLCVNENFYEILLRVGEVRAALSQCFENFG